MDLERAGTLLVMAVSPGLAEADARKQALEWLRKEPDHRRGFPQRQPTVASLLAQLGCGELPEPIATATVSALFLAVRSGPASGYPHTDELGQGEQVSIWRVLGDYLFISECAGERPTAGWVHRGGLKVAPGAPFA